MDCKPLRVFMTTADTGNVTRAAQLLNLVQPAVSRQLRLLEEDIGTELFGRERHGMLLTEAGKALLVYARRAILGWNTRAEIRGAAERVSGWVCVGFLPSRCDPISDALVTATAAKYLGIRMRIFMGYANTLQQWSGTGGIDAALLYGVARALNIQTTARLESALWVVGSPAAAPRRQKPVPPTSLAGW